ncbi:Rz1-like lysis system protein LysC [Gallibacterium sp. ZY190522]
MMLLSGCSTKTETEYRLPPSIYLIPCQQTAFSGSTYGEAIIYLRVVQKEREICASRLAGVIEWSKSNGNAL